MRFVKIDQVIIIDYIAKITVIMITFTTTITMEAVTRVSITVKNLIYLHLFQQLMYPVTGQNHRQTM